MAHDVFISYSHHDKAVADAVCAKLEQCEVRCWIAPRDVAPGAEWAGSITNAIHNSHVMVLVFSANANESPQIRREVACAVDRSVIIVPFRIQDVSPGESLEYYIGNVHWLDALTPPLETHLRILGDVVKAMLQGMPPRDAPVSITQLQSAAAAPPKSKAAEPPQTPAPTQEPSPREGPPNQPPAAAARRRPMGITVIAVWEFICGACLLFGPAYIILTNRFHSLEDSGPLLTLIFLGSISVAVPGYGLVKLRRWGRILTIVIAAMFEIGSVLLLVWIIRLEIFYILPPWFGGDLIFFAGVISAVLHALVLWYMLSHRVKQAFNHQPPSQPQQAS